MRFSEAMRTVTRHGDGWQATVSDDWLQGRSAFGGLQAALALRAMRELVPADMPLRTMQVTFIAPVPAGSVATRAQRLRTGHSVIQVEASLCDGEQTLCRLLGVFGNARPSALGPPNGVRFTYQWLAAAPPINLASMTRPASAASPRPPTPR
ncbi:acyl-CoA thioesterase, partial [Rhodanobacter thiooxydans]|uniref:acyl-CoA thioesterase n=1 Tax=Rhodanobacter thiooxydans TaxID=416169 RepID=UPI000B102703